MQLHRYLSMGRSYLIIFFIGIRWNSLYNVLLIFKKNVLVQKKAMDPLAKIQYAGLLDSLYVPMLHESDNMIAEHLLLLIGAKNHWPGGAQDIL